MSHHVKTISDRKFTINGKVVYKCMNDKWHSKHLTENELKTASTHIIALENPQNQAQ